MNLWYVIAFVIAVGLLLFAYWLLMVAAPRKPVSLYRNARWDFTLRFPDGWTARGSGPEQEPNPEFDGPNRSQIKFAIGQIVPEPTAEQQRKNLQGIALRHGHEVLDLGSAHVGGREHATMISRIPLIGVVKNCNSSGGKPLREQ